MRRAVLATVVALAIAAVVSACGGASQQTRVTHPAQLTGRWVRLREDGTWGDTMDFRPDGTLSGSAGYPVPPGLRWEVKRDPAAGLQFCARESSGGGFCRPYRLAGGRLELIGGPSGHTIFRRVR